MTFGQIQNHQKEDRGAGFSGGNKKQEIMHQQKEAPPDWGSFSMEPPR